ncbi:MAG: hypothetical protein ACRELB_21455, partial [Polyangiaceae bacterium]
LTGTLAGALACIDAARRPRQLVPPAAKRATPSNATITMSPINPGPLTCHASSVLLTSMLASMGHKALVNELVVHAHEHGFRERLAFPPKQDPDCAWRSVDKHALVGEAKVSERPEDTLPRRRIEGYLGTLRRMIERADVSGVTFVVATPSMAVTVLWAGAVEKWAPTLGLRYQSAIQNKKGAVGTYWLAEGALTLAPPGSGLADG